MLFHYDEGLQTVCGELQWGGDLGGGERTGKPIAARQKKSIYRRINVLHLKIFCLYVIRICQAESSEQNLWVQTPVILVYYNENSVSKGTSNRCAIPIAGEGLLIHLFVEIYDAICFKPS